MFQIISKTFLRGLAVILPVGLTFYILWWIGTTGARVMGDLVYRLFDYPPEEGGWWIGLLLAFAVVLAVGLLTQAFLVRRVIGLGESLLSKMPLVKTIYGPLKDMMGLLAADDDKKLGQVVMVKVQGVELMGFVTRENASTITGSEDDANRVAVYLPMSYQLGGFMVTVPRDEVRMLDLTGEEGMRLAITAGVTSAGNGSRS